MNRFLTVLSACVDACVAAGIVLGVPLAAFSLIWLIQDGMSTDMNTYAAAASAIWLLSAGVTIRFSADLSSLGASSNSTQLIVSLTPLLLTSVFLVLGYRAGRKVAHFRSVRGAWLVVAAVQLGLTAAIRSWAESSGTVRLGIASWILPVAVFVVPFVLGSFDVGRRGVEASREGAFVQRALRAVSTWVDTIGDHHRAGPGRAEEPGGDAGGSISAFLSPTAQAVRLAAAIVAAVVAGSAVSLALTFVIHWTDIVTLFEGLHAGVVGVIVLSVAQLMYVPNAVIWSAAWLSGVGFSFGTGSSVSPIGTQTGPLPSFPILGALPPGELSWGFLGLAVPLLAVAVAVLVVGRRYVRALAGASSPWRVWAVTSLGAVVASAAVFGVLAALSAGSLGVGRLVDVGPNGFAVAGALAGLFAVVVLPATAVLLRRQLRVSAGFTPTYRDPFSGAES